MTKYVYMDNSDPRERKELAEIEADTITEADKIFLEQTEMNPRTPWIGVQVFK